MSNVGGTEAEYSLKFQSRPNSHGNAPLGSVTEFGLSIMTMTMTMTLKEVQPPVVRGLALPYKRECRGHDPVKKSLLELVRRALLARFAHAHS